LKSKSLFQNGHHKIGLLLATQFNFRKEFDIIRNSTSKVPQSDLAIASYSEELTWEYNDNKAWSHQAGFIALQQQNEYAGRYFIPAYKAYNLGGYWISKWHSQQWNLDAGLRYDNKKISSHRLGQDGDYFDEHDFNFSTLGASFNAGYKINNLWKVNGTAALASRAPQVNELLSNGIHHGTATFERGDIDLVPEKAVNISINNSWTSTNKKINIEATLYRNQVNDFIYQQPRPDQPVLTIAGAFPLLVYQQNNVVLSGIDFSSRVDIIEPLTWNFKYAMLRARNTDTDDWLIRMPADKIENELSFNFNDTKSTVSNFVSASVSNTFKQTRVPTDKNGRQDYKEAPGAYTLLNFDAGTTLKNAKFPLAISFGIRNVLNTVYRDYLNSLRYFTDETGRSFQIRLTLPLKNI
jgi:iron complex outermembrane recepter protein